MKANQFLKELRALGVEVSHKTNHLLLKRGNKWTTVKRHPSQEISEALRARILKQLGLK